jgi:cation diffusion facilitator family transporter
MDRHHSASPGHSHDHSHLQGTKLLAVTLLNLLITVAEIIGGILSNSLSLLSDAIHNLGDTLALFIAFIANKIGNKKADKKRTFGYKRIEILAAFFNALVLIGICVFLLKEAYERFMDPQPIKGQLMLIVAVIGLIVNWISVLILQKNKKENINIKAAYLHLLGDTLSSVAVIVGGLAIWLFNVVWVDPLITVLVSLYIIYHTWGILKESIDILMQSVPEDIDIEKIERELETVPEVKDAHHIHIWKLNDDQLYFESHINIKENLDIRRINEVREKIELILRKRFGISHTTLQFEYLSPGDTRTCCFDHQH